MRRMKKLVRIGCFFVNMILAYICASIIKICNPNMKNIWIISERGIDARDNGYFFYKYMVENHPEQQIWYVIDSKSADASKVQVLGKWIEFESFKHYLYYALAKVRISSSMWGGDLPKADYFKKIRKYIGRKKKFVFLKHGIIKDYLPQHCYGEGFPDIYVCGAKPEYEYVKSTFCYPEGVVKYLGLARFDNLHNREAKQQILFMPTFRKWLPKMTHEEIADSQYVKAWNDAINDERLIKILENSNLELIFYPHIVMQKCVDLFESKSNRIKIAKFSDYDVQTLLIESKLLVTDFSSVFFDFGYMEKPVIYYQFDRERYIKEHYDFTKGYFSYDNDGFGDVVTNIDGLVLALREAIKDELEINDKYKQRINDFFPLKDARNCERIYNSILEQFM